MNEPVKSLITENIYSVLGSIANLGGSQNDAIVEREKVRGSKIADRHLLVMDDGDTVIEDSPQNKDDYNASYTIITQVTTSDAANAPHVDVERARLVADVRKALMTDVTRGGNAILTTIENSAQLTPGQFELPGDAISVTVMYRTARDDPYSF